MKNRNKKYWKSILNSKCNASIVVSDMIPVLITIVVTGILLLFYAAWIASFETKQKVDSIAREYVLRMGTTGCLTDEDRALLIDELEENDIKEISLYGTTMNQVESGEKVILRISGVFDSDLIRMTDVFNWNYVKKGDAKEFEVEKSTTALY